MAAQSGIVISIGDDVEYSNQIRYHYRYARIEYKFTGESNMEAKEADG